MFDTCSRPGSNAILFWLFVGCPGSPFREKGGHNGFGGINAEEGTEENVFGIFPVKQQGGTAAQNLLDAGPAVAGDRLRRGHNAAAG